MLDMVKALVFLSFFLAARAAVDPDLVGTWSTKSRQVITGPVCQSPYTQNKRFYAPRAYVDTFLGIL